MAGADDLLEERPGRPVHRVEEDPEAGPADRVEVDEAAIASRYGVARSIVSTAPPGRAGSGRSAERAMASYVAGVALPPNEDLYFTPFQSGGLCDAVIAMPPRSPRGATCHEAQGVGTGRSDRRTRKPVRGEERRALGGELRREEARVVDERERPRVAGVGVRGVDRPRGGRVTTRRTLSNVRSRAIRPRQPSVPKTMGALSMGRPIVGERTEAVQRGRGRARV